LLHGHLALAPRYFEGRLGVEGFNIGVDDGHGVLLLIFEPGLSRRNSKGLVGSLLVKSRSYQNHGGKKLPPV
jgi:hypothetical protein